MNFFSVFIIFTTVFIELLIAISGYRILAVFPFNSRSHNYFFEGVTRALALKGHQVDVVTHYKLENPPKNYKTIINLDGTTRRLINHLSFNDVHVVQKSIVKIFSQMHGNQLCELLGLPELQNLIKNPPQDPPYDLLITEMFCASCFIGLGHVLKVPVVTVSSIMEVSWSNDILGNQHSAAFFPNILSNSTKISTFWNRLMNVLQIHRSRYDFYMSTGDSQTKAIRKYLDPNMTDIRLVERNVALTFFNSFYSLHGIRSKTAAVIEVAGIHLENSETKLPPNFQEWMDESKNGVVLFTMGSMVLLETLPRETLLAFYAAFEKIAPIRVLMKIVDEKKLPPGLPSNVRISAWLPQLPLMGHNNTRLFITHGGLLSTLEALHYGIPTIGLPLFGDQFANAHLLQKKKMSILLDYKTITEEKLNKAFNSLLHDPIYRESAKRESKLFHDRPLTPSQTVNYWVEYVIRNGPNVLRSPAVDLQWWQNELLDVYGFLMLCFLMLSILTILSLKLIVDLIFKFFLPPTRPTTTKRRAILSF